jgi:hypothetical protein
MRVAFKIRHTGEDFVGQCFEFFVLRRNGSTDFAERQIDGFTMFKSLFFAVPKNIVGSKNLFGNIFAVFRRNIFENVVQMLLPKNI